MSRLEGISHNHHVAPTAEGARLSAGSRIAATSAPPAQAGDVTRLSSTSGTFAQAILGSDVRTAKVAALQQAIQTGTYKVSAADVADKLITNLLDGR